MAVRAGVPVLNAQTLIHDPGRSGLLSLYRKAEMPLAMLPVIRAAIEIMNDTSFDGRSNDLERYRTRVISRVLTQSDTFASDDADYLVEKLGEIMAVA